MIYFNYNYCFFTLILQVVFHFQKVDVIFQMLRLSSIFHLVGLTLDLIPNSSFIDCLEVAQNVFSQVFCDVWCVGVFLPIIIPHNQVVLFCFVLLVVLWQYSNTNEIDCKTQICSQKNIKGHLAIVALTQSCDFYTTNSL